MTKSLACHYPPSRPTAFVPLTSEAEVGGFVELPVELISVRQSLNDEIPTRSEADADSHDDSPIWWFEAPDTWLVDQAPGGVKQMPPSLHDRDEAVRTIEEWMIKWTTGQRNPLFHLEVYQYRLPDCIQDAYLSLSTYVKRNNGNTHLILRMLYDKSSRLVKGVQTVETSVPEDPLELLARTQALLIYQVIGLFDGDIRLRHLAEQHVPILSQWQNELVESARCSCRLGQFIISDHAEKPPIDVPWEKSVWHSWLLAESIRRTYLVASMIQGMYMTSRNRVHYCLGGMVFTSRTGFWDAPSAIAWQQKCVDVCGGLVRLTEMNELLAKLDLNELDEFAELVLKVTFGSEQMSKRRIESVKA